MIRQPHGVRTTEPTARRSGPGRDRRSNPVLATSSLVAGACLSSYGARTDNEDMGAPLRSVRSEESDETPISEVVVMVDELLMVGAAHPDLARAGH